MYPTVITYTLSVYKKLNLHKKSEIANDTSYFYFITAFINVTNFSYVYPLLYNSYQIGIINGFTFLYFE